MAEKKSMLVYYDYEQHFSFLSDEQLGKLIRAMLDYDKRQELPDFAGEPALQMCFSFIQAQLDRDRSEYEVRCQKNADNGKKGGRPSKNQTVFEETERFSEKPKKPDTDKDTDEDTDTDMDKDKDTSKPSALPSPLETLVYEYGKETVDRYVKRVKGWYSEKGSVPSDLEATVRRWLEQDAVKPVDHRMDKYKCIINKF